MKILAFVLALLVGGTATKTQETHKVKRFKRDDLVFDTRLAVGDIVFRRGSLEIMRLREDGKVEVFGQMLTEKDRKYSREVYLGLVLWLSGAMSETISSIDYGAIRPECLQSEEKDDTRPDAGYKGSL